MIIGKTIECLDDVLRDQLQVRTIESDGHERFESLFAILSYFLSLAKSSSPFFSDGHSQLMKKIRSFFDSKLLFLLSAV
jgi:hypothetical protein